MAGEKGKNGATCPVVRNLSFVLFAMLQHGARRRAWDVVSKEEAREMSIDHHVSGGRKVVGYNPRPILSIPVLAIQPQSSGLATSSLLPR